MDSSADIRPYYEHDDQYLFRLTSTFGWDEAISLCETLVHDIEVAAAAAAAAAVAAVVAATPPSGGGGGSASNDNNSRRASSEEEDDIGYNDNDDDTTATSTSDNDENYFNDSLHFVHESNSNNKSGGDDSGYSINSKESSSSSCQPSSSYCHDHYFRHRHHNLLRRQLRQCLHNAQTQLYYMDQWGNTPLHAASYVKPPLRVIEALFRVGRLLWRYASYYLNKDDTVKAKAGAAEAEAAPIWARLCKDGSTPFLVACSTGASLPVLNCYLDEIVYYFDQRWSSSHYCQMAVLLPDNQGNTPMMGYMSLHHKWNSRTRWVARHHQRYRNFACRMLRFASNPTLFLPLAAAEEQEEEQEESTIVLVHRCASIASYCPVSLLDWVVSLPSRFASGCDVNDDDNNGDYGGRGSWLPRGWFPGDVCAATKDNDGKLPFHRALEGAGVGVVIPSSILMEEASPKLERNRLYIVQKLLLWYPLAASTALPNGRSPLVHAIAHGGAWHGIRDSTTTTAASASANDAHLGLLQLLWRNSPEQSLDIDPVSGLYPFMLAATTVLPAEGLLSRRERLGRERIVLENVYNLLRKDPQLISLGLFR